MNTKVIEFNRKISGIFSIALMIVMILISGFLYAQISRPPILAPYEEGEDKTEDDKHSLPIFLFMTKTQKQNNCH